MTAASCAIRVLVLTALYFLAFVAGFTVSNLKVTTGDGTSKAARSGGLIASLLVVCSIHTIVVSYVISRSIWHGSQLVITVFIELFGVMTVMPQIEAAIFMRELRSATVIRFVAAGVITNALFAPAAVLILGKMKAAGRSRPARLLSLSGDPLNWFWALTVIACVYVILYLTFGYFVALRSEAVKRFYGYERANTLWEQVSTIARQKWWLLMLQAIRALLWAALGVPILLMFEGDWWSAAVAVGVVFAALMNAQLLLPNPYMPRGVRYVHMIETAACNFIFGIVMTSILWGSGSIRAEITVAYCTHVNPANLTHSTTGNRLT